MYVFARLSMMRSDTYSPYDNKFDIHKNHVPDMWQPRNLPRSNCKTRLECGKPHCIDTTVKYSDYSYNQTLRPPTFNTGYRSNGHNMDRTSSHGSSDSGYGTRTPSVASPAPQPSYPTQIYPVQNSPYQNYSTPGYSSQSYFPNRQLSQQNPTYTYSDAQSPSIEVIKTAPISSSRHKKEHKIR